MSQELSYKGRTRVLGTICELSGGYGFPDSFQGYIWGEIPFIKVSDMSLPGNERKIIYANNYVSKRTADSLGWKSFPAGSIVFAKVGAALKLNRRRILIRPTLIDNNMMAAIPKSSLVSSFLYHFLCTIDFGNFVQDGALPSVNQEQIGSIKIPDINKKEQRCIAEILDTIDEAIQRTKALISKLKAMKQGLIHDLLTRGLDENGKLRDPKAHPEQFKDSPIGTIPQSWKMESFHKFYKTPSLNGIYKTKKYYGKGPLMLHMPQMFRGLTIDFSDAARVEVTPEELNRYSLQNGDLVFARRSLNFEGAGRCSLVDNLKEPATFESSIIRVRIKQDELMSKFANQFLNSAIGFNLRLSLIRQVAVSGVSSGDIASIPIPCPSLGEQNRIIQIVAAHDACIRAEEKYRDKLKLQKNGLMHDLLTGKVRVKA